MRALVTGGTGRVGSAISERLRAEGWTVFAAGRADGDLADANAAQRLVDRAADELGGLDLLVNAAGEGFAPKPVDEVTEADWDAALGATAKGSFFVTQACAGQLRESEGVVLMIEDVAAYEPWPSFAPGSALPTTSRTPSSTSSEHPSSPAPASSSTGAECCNPPGFRRRRAWYKDDVCGACTRYRVSR